jgi:hypothetical protein
MHHTFIDFLSLFNMLGFIFVFANSCVDTWIWGSDAYNIWVKDIETQEAPTMACSTEIVKYCFKLSRLSPKILLFTHLYKLDKSRFLEAIFIIIGDVHKYLLSLNIFDLFPIFNIKIALMFLSNYQKLKRYLFLIRQKCLTNLKKNQKKSVSPPWSETSEQWPKKFYCASVTDLLCCLNCQCRASVLILDTVNLLSVTRP